MSMKPMNVTVIFPSSMDISVDRARWYLEHAIRGYWQRFATDTDPIRQMSKCTVVIVDNADLPTSNVASGQSSDTMLCIGCNREIVPPPNSVLICSECSELPHSPGPDALVAAAKAYVEAVEAVPAEDIWDTETGEFEAGAGKTVSDWSWKAHDDKTKAAFENLCVALGRRP